MGLADPSRGAEPGEWTIRPATRSDIAAVLALWRTAASSPSVTDTEDGLERLLRQDPGSLLVAEVGDAIVGSLIVGWDGWRASFYRLAVDPAWRRKGIATSLIRTGERRATELGAIRLTAIVTSEEGAAMALWQAAGFQRQPGMSRFVRVMDDQSPS